MGDNYVNIYGPAKALSEHLRQTLCSLANQQIDIYGKPRGLSIGPFGCAFWKASKGNNAQRAFEKEQLQKYLELEFITPDDKKLLESYMAFLEPQKTGIFSRTPNYDKDTKVIEAATFADQTYFSRVEARRNKTEEMKSKLAAEKTHGSSEEPDGGWTKKHEDRQSRKGPAPDGILI